MADDSKLCETCPWPLDCCTDEGTPKVKPVAVDCPRDHELWERRMGETRLAVITSTVIAPALDEEEILV